jgi:hypothetical protein
MPAESDLETERRDRAQMGPKGLILSAFFQEPLLDVHKGIHTK